MRTGRAAKIKKSIVGAALDDHRVMMMPVSDRTRDNRKLGDLAGFTSAIALDMIALPIGYEAVTRLLAPVPIQFGQAIPIAALGLAVNVASAWLLSAGRHDHHGHGHGHGRVEPHAFTARVNNGGEAQALVFTEHEHAAHDRDNNTRSAVVHVMPDAMVSVMVIVGLLLARWLGWVRMDPLAGLVSTVVIASWSHGLIRDTGAILPDMNPDRGLTDQIRQVAEAPGDAVADLHLWRLRTRPSRRHRLRRHQQRARQGALPRQARSPPRALAPDRRDRRAARTEAGGVRGGGPCPSLLRKAGD